MAADYRHRGAVFALASALLFGASIPSSRLWIGEMSPWVLASFRYLGNGSGLVIVDLVRRPQARVVSVALGTAELPRFAVATPSIGTVVRIHFDTIQKHSSKTRLSS